MTFPVRIPPSDPPEIAERLWRDLEGRLAFDVGAHYGENFPFLRAAGFKVVVALEPELTSFEKMVGNHVHPLGADDEFHVDYRHVAVSDVSGTVDLAEVPKAISKGELVTAGTDGMEWTPSDWSAARLRNVRSVTIDDLVHEVGVPNLIVVDTEGHEARVLAGALGILTTLASNWLIEFHSPQNLDYCESTLTSAGYDTEVIRHPHYAPNSRLWYQHGWVRGLQP